jgi:hypothetical protein
MSAPTTTPVFTGIGQGLPGGGYRLDDGHPRHIDDVAAHYMRLLEPAMRRKVIGKNNARSVAAERTKCEIEAAGVSCGRR